MTFFRRNISLQIAIKLCWLLVVTGLVCYLASLSAYLVKNNSIEMEKPPFNDEVGLLDSKIDFGFLRHSAVSELFRVLTC